MNLLQGHRKGHLSDSFQYWNILPQTNGRVEHFNGRISDILKGTHFPSSRALAETMSHYLKVYNYHIPQKNIGHQTPIQKLKEWQTLKPELFKKRVYDLSELDN